MKLLIVGMAILASTSAFSANEKQISDQLKKIRNCASLVEQGKKKESLCNEVVQKGLKFGISKDKIKKAIIKGTANGISIKSAEATTFKDLQNEIAEDALKLKRYNQQLQQTQQ